MSINLNGLTIKITRTAHLKFNLSKLNTHTHSNNKSLSVKMSKKNRNSFTDFAQFQLIIEIGESRSLTRQTEPQLFVIVLIEELQIFLTVLIHS